MALLRWASLLCAAVCVGFCGTTGVWNGLVLVAVAFFAIFLVTIPGIWAALIGEDPRPERSHLDELDHGGLVEHADDEERGEWS